MTAMTFVWLSGATAVFVAANAILKVYATKGQLPILIGALALFCVGNWLMVQVMKANGLGPALSTIFPLVAISVLAILVFGERPTSPQVAGMLLGIVAVAMIAWPTGARA